MAKPRSDPYQLIRSPQLLVTPNILPTDIKLLNFTIIGVSLQKLQDIVTESNLT